MRETPEDMGAPVTLSSRLSPPAKIARIRKRALYKMEGSREGRERESRREGGREGEKEKREGERKEKYLEYKEECERKEERVIYF